MSIITRDGMFQHTPNVDNIHFDLVHRPCILFEITRVIDIKGFYRMSVKSSLFLEALLFLCKLPKVKILFPSPNGGDQTFRHRLPVEVRGSTYEREVHKLSLPVHTKSLTGYTSLWNFNTR